MLRALVIAVPLLLAACPAAAAGPPPDPSAGEPYDGRAQRPSWRENLLLVPRLLLAPLRLIFAGIGWPMHRLLDWDERNRVLETILAAITSRDGKIGVRPAFQYSVSFSPVIGVRFFDQKLLGPDTDFSVTTMTGGVNIVYAEVDARPTPSERALGVTMRTLYNRRDDQLFHGIGLATDSKDLILRPSRYAVDALDTGGNLTWTPAIGLFIAFDTMFGLRRFGNGRFLADELPIEDVYCIRSLSGLCIPGTVDPVLVPGFNRGTQFFRVGVNLRADSRDNWYRPSSGALVEAGFDWTHGLGFDDSHYLRGHAAMSAVVDLWQRSRTFVVRFEANDIEPFGSTPVPFSELIVLGGPDTLRGFRLGRFRNYSSLFAGFEYRWPVWMWMDAALFAEYGGVFGRGFSGFDIQRMVPDVGAGVRLRSSDTFFARAQVAYGWGDGWQFFFSVNTGM